MRPPMASDHVVEPKKRILYTKKHAPYNSGEERTVAESVARRLCVIGVAIPSPSRGKDDELGGWSLTGDEAAMSRARDKALKESAGDFRPDLEEEEKRREAEEKRVVEAANKKAEKNKDEAAAKSDSEKKKFLKGKKPANEPKD